MLPHKWANNYVKIKTMILKLENSLLLFSVYLFPLVSLTRRALQPLCGTPAAKQGDHQAEVSPQPWVNFIKSLVYFGEIYFKRLFLSVFVFMFFFF